MRSEEKTPIRDPDVIIDNAFLEIEEWKDVLEKRSGFSRFSLPDIIALAEKEIIVIDRELSKMDAKGRREYGEKLAEFKELVRRAKNGAN